MPPDPRAFQLSPLFQELMAIGLGEKPLPETRAKRHHFVPQLLLRRFCRGADQRLFQLDANTGRPIKVGTREAASRRRYYEFEDEDGTKNSTLEAFFALIESHAAEALDRLVESEQISDPDRATLSFFFALLGVRTPEIRRMGEQMGKDMFEFMVGTEAADPETFAATYRHWKGEDASDEEAEQFRQDTLRMMREGELELVDPGGANTMKMLLQVSADTTQSIFGEMTWTLVRAAKSEFVTSDRGLAIFDPTPRFPWSTEALLSSPNSQTSIPISSSMCLVLSPGEPRMHRMDADPIEVTQLNLRTYGWADRYIYGPGQDIVTALRRAAKKRPQLVVRPRPFRQVILVEAEPGDTRLADQHRRRGWPAYLMAPGPEGEPRKFDYVVVGEDVSPLEVGIETTKMAKARAVREVDISD